ncbi:MAG: alpha/beta fold hydrolase, partial [Methylomonas sp.]|nr:alpha/beta fold hydrolase [Methylomonas sp.]
MKVFPQGSFRPPASFNSIEDSLIIHKHDGSQNNRHLVIFVHGLGGRRYGDNSTWGFFPTFIFEDFPKYDIGLYAFRSAFGRMKFWRSVPVDREAQVLADTIKTLIRNNTYDFVVLIGHSLGGLLCKGAVSCLFNSQRRNFPVSDIVMMATPQLGSLRVPGFLRWLTTDARVLRAHSDFIEKLVIDFQTKFHCTIDPPLDDKVHLRIWSVVAAADFWVDPLSAGIGVMESQKLTVSGGHTEIVKPDDKNSDAYIFVHSCLKEALKPRPVLFRTENCRPTEYSELSDLHDFASQFFSEPISNLRTMQDWWKVNDTIFQTIERISKSNGR